MRILVVGSGGREHALVAVLAASARAPEILCAPGNPGTAEHAENVAVAADALDGLVALAQTRDVDLVIVGPEVPLVLGLADRLADAGIAVVGPRRAVARLEGSKAHANGVMARHGIPTAASRTFGLGAVDEARAYVEAQPLPVVLKADGLASGKGVVVAETRQDARRALADMLEAGAFGAAGQTVVVEDFLDGEEASVFVLTDGTTHALLPAAQDHKRLLDGDRGPNTGGMGAYAPAPVVTDAVMARVEAEIVRPLLDGLRADGTPYQGVLYVGLMIDADGAPRVVEFNVRFGDPEAQVLLPMLQTDAAELFTALADGRLSEIDVRVRDGAAACVVLASEGYPAAPQTGRPIAIGCLPERATLFHAGTACDAAGGLVTSGGRVLGATGLGDTLEEALATAYAGADAVRFEGKQIRRDIGAKALPRSANA